MAEAQQTQQKKQPQAGKGQQQNQKGKQPGQKVDRKAMAEQYRQRKIDRAGREDYDVVSRRALDTGEFIALINYNDNLTYQIRQQMGGRRKELTLEVAMEFLGRCRALKEQLNQINAEMSAIMGYPYNPPRGFDNPLESGKKGGNGKATAATAEVKAAAADTKAATA